MNIIKKLSLHEAQKIAAGEVIDRPAHCIKELVENSIDAGATSIIIECKMAGKEMISVIDNGCGMSYQDLLVAHQRHTTSKIETVDDLQTLTTFGFRGEALASMCAVARVVLTTKTDFDEYATELTVENQEILSERKVARISGTTVVIHNLFSSIPARQKFLKKDATEWNQCVSVIKSFIAQHIHIHFIIKHEGQLVFNCPPVASYKDRLEQLYGGMVASQILLIEPTDDKGVKIEGALTDPTFGRFDKSGIYLFVNKRIVKNFHLIRSLLKGYDNSLQPERYPGAILSITVDPSVIDVNVHPKKEEVLFEHSLIVDKCISEKVKNTLLHAHKKPITHVFSSPFITTSETSSFGSVSSYRPSQPLSSAMHHVYPTESTVPDGFPFGHSENETISYDETPIVPEKVVQQRLQYGDLSSSVIPHEYVFVGMYKRTYMLVEDNDGLLVIDQHALHERLLYNQWTLSLDSFEKVQLLFPVTFSLQGHEYTMLEPYMQLIHTYGIHIEQIGAVSYKVNALPVILKNQPIELIIREMLSWIQEESHITQEDLYTKLTEKLHTLIACKTAIKAGDILPQETIDYLLASFYNLKDSFTCPHGRPISWRLPLVELEKKFKRDYK